jgi:PIN domain nuclease of toxin-antitoxin system
MWFLAGSPELSPVARNIIENEDNEIFVSIASFWEIAIKIVLRV